jgi:hypothetical protein
MKPCVDPITGLRMKPSALAVLNRLRKGPATTHDLCQPDVGGIRFSARIKELRDLGFVIPPEVRLALPTRGSLYELLAEPDTSTSPATLTPAGDTPAPISTPSARAQSAGVTGSSGQARTGSVTAIPERTVAVEKPCPSVRVPDAQLSLLDWLAA